jgi:hypothetical protein
MRVGQRCASNLYTLFGMSPRASVQTGNTHSVSSELLYPNSGTKQSDVAAINGDEQRTGHGTGQKSDKTAARRAGITAYIQPDLDSIGTMWNGVPSHDVRSALGIFPQSHSLAVLALTTMAANRLYSLDVDPREGRLIHQPSCFTSRSGAA